MVGKAFALFIVVLAMIGSLDGWSQSAFAITNVSVIPMTSDTVLEKHTIVVKNGKITQLAPSRLSKIPRGLAVIDGTGKYLMPGLFDMHAHFFEEQGSHRDTKQAELMVMLANGLTTVRIMAGHPAYLRAREHVKNGTWDGPDLFIASPQFVGQWPWSSDFKNYEIVNSTESAKEAVKKYKKEKYDEIKLTFMISADVYQEIVKTAKSEDIRVTGHVGPEVKLPAALAAKQQVEHMDEFLLPDTTYNHGQSVSDMNIWRKNAWETVPYLDESRMADLVASVKAAGIFVTPTNFFFVSSFGEGMSDEAFKQRPDYAYIPDDLIEERWKIKNHYWKNAPPLSSRERYVSLRKKMTYELWKAGVPLMAGSDSPEWFLVTGFSIHDELKTFVESGLTPFAAIQTATVNTAHYLEVLDKKGTVEIGKQADLMLLDENPMEDISNTRKIHAMIKKGEYLNKERLAEMLDSARRELKTKAD